MKTILKTSLVFIFGLISFSEDYGQNSQLTFSSFKEFKLGMSTDELLKLHPEIAPDSIKFDWHFPYHSEVQYDYMNGYKIDGFVLSSGDKIDLKLGIYQGKLALIELEYGIFQSFNELLNAFVTKYGKAFKIDRGQYYDFLEGTYVNMANFYWKSQNYVLNLSGKDGAKVRVLYANEIVQKEIKSRKSKESLKKIE